MIGIGAGVYIGMMYMLAKDFIIDDIKMIAHNLKK
jgi:hypothetical protein